MPEGILKFNLPDELDAFIAAQRSSRIVNMFEEVRYHLVARQKKSLTEIEKEVIAKIIDILDETAVQHGISL